VLSESMLRFCMQSVKLKASVKYTGHQTLTDGKGGKWKVYATIALCLRVTFHQSSDSVDAISSISMKCNENSASLSQ
jgi:hypothetical protein